MAGARYDSQAQPAVPRPPDPRVREDAMTDTIRNPVEWTVAQARQVGVVEHKRAREIHGHAGLSQRPADRVDSRRILSRVDESDDRA